MDVARIDDDLGPGGDAGPAPQGGPSPGREVGAEQVDIDPWLQPQRRQFGRQHLAQAVLDHRGARRLAHQRTLLGHVAVGRRVAAVGLLLSLRPQPHLGEVILVVLEMHQVGDLAGPRDLDHGAAGDLAGGPADQQGVLGLEGAVETDHGLGMVDQVLHGEEFVGRRPMGVGVHQPVPRADGHGVALPVQLPGEAGDMSAAVVAEAAVGDEHDLLQRPAALQFAPLARDPLEQGHDRDGGRRLRLGFIWLSARLQGSCGGSRPEARAIYKRA